MLLWSWGGTVYFLLEVAFKSATHEPERISWTMLVLAMLLTVPVERCGEQLPWEVPLIWAGPGLCRSGNGCGVCGRADTERLAGPGDLGLQPHVGKYPGPDLPPVFPGVVGLVSDIYSPCLTGSDGRNGRPTAALPIDLRRRDP